MKDKSKSKRQEKVPHHGKDGSALRGHGVYDTPVKMESNESAGYHSGRPLPPSTSLGGDALPSGENGGAIGAGGELEPVQVPFVAKSQR